MATSRPFRFLVSNFGHLGRFAIAFAVCLYVRDFADDVYQCIQQSHSTDSLPSIIDCLGYSLFFTRFLSFLDGKGGISFSVGSTSIFSAESATANTVNLVLYYAPIILASIAVALWWGWLCKRWFPADR